MVPSQIIAFSLPFIKRVNPITIPLTVSKIPAITASFPTLCICSFLHTGYSHKTYLVFGGATRDRTADLYTASVALSQLSYSPCKRARNLRQQAIYVNEFLKIL